MTQSPSLPVELPVLSAPSRVSRSAVSVVVPCYNHAATVTRALRSVVAQTLLPFEIIVVDDASADRSVQAVREFAAHSPVPVLLIELPQNVGAAAARNTGWAEARGSYLAFLDADDAWHPRKLEFQVPLMDADPELALSGHAFLMAPDEHAAFPEVTQVGIRPLPLSELLTRNRLPTPSVLLRRDVRERFQNGLRYGEDYLLWLEIVLGGGRAGLLDTPLLRLFKSSYGEAGLSAQLWRMERAELGVYLKLCRLGLLSRWRWALCSVLSVVKYLRRLVYVRLGLFRASR